MGTETWRELIPSGISQAFELYNFNHAAEILASAYPQELFEIMQAFTKINLNVDDLLAPGGSESNIPKKLSESMRPFGWEEVKITGDLLVKLHKRHSGPREGQMIETVVKDYVGGHNIDYLKGKVAVDMEWNSKDQTFDRDLYAFRAFYECGIIECGVIVTRSAELNPLFDQLGIKQKYGASTTWMGKLLPRIQARRHGGCPILAVGITSAAVTGWDK
jgi:hypothetical protein